MPEPTAEDIAKKLTLTLDGWHKKNEKHIKLLDNLVLDCELCTTKEVKAIVQKEIDLSLKILKPEFDKLNKQNKNLLKDGPKAERKDMLKEIEDIVADRETGRVVAPGDVPALRDALTELLAHPEQARALAERAAVRAREQFSMSVVAGRWAEVLARAAAR